MEWNINWEEEDIDGSFYLHGIVCSNEGSASDIGNNSSTKSSISPVLETSVSSCEPFIGLKLGKRTYFENNLTKSNSKTSSFSDIPTSTWKKQKSSCQSTLVIQRCQVEGCNLDLSSAKEYHRKHRVCESHSKCSRVVVGGIECRFCQQCSRFHGLGEFDEKKRSCRRRLSDHNARRRKPQRETIHFNSTNLSSSFYGGRQRLSFVLNNAPSGQSKPAARTTWDNLSNSTYSVSKMKADKSGVINCISHSLGVQLQSACNVPTIAFNRPVTSKATKVDTLDQGIKESFPPNVDALDIRRALSLLSNNSWGLYDPTDLIALNQPETMPPNNPAIIQDGTHSVPQCLPLSSTDYWQTEQQSINPHYQEFQVFERF